MKTLFLITFLCGKSLGNFMEQYSIAACMAINIPQHTLEVVRLLRICAT